MILEVFSMYDVAVKAYTQPFYMHSTDEAIRAVRNEACNGDSQMAKNPTDFVLYRLGTYDNLSGMFTQDENVRIGAIAELTVVDTEAKTLTEVA